jgi:FtsZ-interacting cell division protein ZipA
VDEPSLGLVLIILAAILVGGLAYDAYWALIEWFARKFVREPLDRRAQRRAKRPGDD